MGGIYVGDLRVVGYEEGLLPTDSRYLLDHNPRSEFTMYECILRVTVTFVSIGREPPLFGLLQFPSLG